MNPTIAAITFRAMLGRKRALLLFALPAILLLLAVILRITDHHDLETSTAVLQNFALGTLLPLLGLIAGTGVIGPEIDDGQIMYMLTKPISRQTITLTKLAVAIALMALFGVLPALVAGVILTGFTAQLSVAFAIGILVGGVAYCAVFVALAVTSRFAVVIGLLYVMVWEVLIGNFAPGARSLSIQQWALSVTDALTSAVAVTSEVKLGVAVTLLAIVTAGGTALAVVRLRSMSVTGAD
jgi:ABC-2 type transport system permease protein